MEAVIEKSTLKFLKNLKLNNTREWFQDNHSQYVSAHENVLHFADAMIRKIEEFDGSIYGITAKESVFRIYKDTRFSKDKTPYKTNFGIFVKAGNKKDPGAGYYLHLEPGNSFIGGGLHSPPPKILFQIRTAILEESDHYRNIINNIEFNELFGDVGMDPVKTVPRGFDKDNPDISLIRYKSYVAACSVKDSEIISEDFLKKIMERYKLLKPFNQFLNKIAGLA